MDKSSMLHVGERDISQIHIVEGTTTHLRVRFVMEICCRSIILESDNVSIVNSLVKKFSLLNTCTVLTFQSIKGKREVRRNKRRLGFHNITMA
jgi:hypothetical protein